MADPKPTTAPGGETDLLLDLNGRSQPLLGRGGARTETRPVEGFLARETPGLPVLLGAGLGHGLRKLLAGYDGPVAVVDKEAAIQAHSPARREAEASGRVLWLDGEDAREALAELTRWQMENGGAPLVPLPHPVYLRLDPDHYTGLKRGLEASSRFNFWEKARYAKFTGDTPRVLLISSRYFLMGEIMAACERMGVEHRFLDLSASEGEDGEVGRADFVEELLRSVLEFKPDFVFTINHLGVDREGVLTDLLARLELPLASWFVDNPHLILYIYDNLTSPWTTVFTWDADNLDSLAELGFPNVRYLPLGTDVHRFRPDAPPGPDSWRSRVSFVGNSMVHKVARRLEVAAPPPELREAYPKIAAGFGGSEDWSVRAFMERSHPDFMPAFESLGTTERKLAFETLVTWESTRAYRLACVRSTLPFTPLIVGDPYWKESLPGEGSGWRYHSELGYYDDLPRFYPLSEVNFNCTSKQMKGAVNQRVFDVPASGAFLLTDHRRQMEDLFEPGREVVFYTSPEEASELAARYLDDPAARARVAEAARQRVLAEHTYDHRLAELLEAMRSIYG
ncbi:CgeB family protein [Desulfohalovibrio reitneri]|uniref:CgeB family protein n=1 Tax=Desulfohalovibrio reitneri TaxID=1307759 RepID=UPI0004A73425|nr:glycosyltransferase [Desulfohalovibrio reitneri]